MGPARESRRDGVEHRSVGVGFGRRVPVGTVIGGLLMIAMGVLALVLAFAGPGMPSDGWQPRLSGWLQHMAAVATGALSFVPGWVLGLILVAGFGLAMLSLTRGKRVGARKDSNDNTTQLDTTAHRPRP